MKIDLNKLFYLKQAQWNWGRCIRASLCVGMPFAIGIYYQDIMPWMWISMGALMMTTGEGNGPYKERIISLVKGSTLGAAGYLFGYLSLLPYAYTILVMAIVGWLASLLSRKSHTLSIGCLQLLLTAAIAIGVPSIDNFIWPAIYYLLGTLAYILFLAVEWLILEKPNAIPKKSVAATSPSADENPPAIALALCLTAAYSAKYVIHENHWFWIPLTVGLIMKPDLGNIFYRSILRCIGTLLGVFIATLILTLFPKDVWLALFIGILAGVLPWNMARSYALQAIILTPLVLILVDVIIPNKNNINYSGQRFIDTVIGASIVFVVCYISIYISRAFNKQRSS